MSDVEEISDLRGPRSLEQWLAHLSERQKVKRYIPKYMKPKIRFDPGAQFGYRCPICFKKEMFADKVRECLDKCWKELPGRVFALMDEQNSNPMEIGSWQWDIGNHRLMSYVGVAEFDTGPPMYFTSLRTRPFTKVTLEELVQVLVDNKDNLYLWQDGKLPLPPELEWAGALPREVFEESNLTAFGQMAEDMKKSA